MRKDQVLATLTQQARQLERRAMDDLAARAAAVALGDTDLAESRAASAQETADRLAALRRVIEAVEALQGEQVTLAKMQTIGDQIGAT